MDDSPLSQFFSDSFGSASTFCIVEDNARSPLKQTAPIASTKCLKHRRKPCRWDSSLSVKDCLLQKLNAPKRRSDDGSHPHQSVATRSQMRFPELSNDLMSLKDAGESKQERDGDDAPDDDDMESYHDFEGFESLTVSSSDFEVCVWANKSFPPGSSSPNHKAGPPKMPLRRTESCYPVTTAMEEMEQGLSSVC